MLCRLKVVPLTLGSEFSPQQYILVNDLNKGGQGLAWAGFTWLGASISQ